MNRAVKLITALLLAVLLISLPAGAASIYPSPTDRFFVNDFADVMDDATETAIYNAGAHLYQKTGAQAVVVTIDSLDGAPVREYALQLGREWGIGNEEKNNGVLLLLAVNDREVTIEVGYGLEGAITDAQSGLLLDRYAIPYFSVDEFAEGLQATYDAIVNEVYLEYGMEADPNYVPVEEYENDGSAYGILLVLAVLAVLGWMLRSPYGLTRFVVMKQLLGNHHHGGGFHGGFGGGGGFRGGGGSFGGGGASRRF